MCYCFMLVFFVVFNPQAKTQSIWNWRPKTNFLDGQHLLINAQIIDNKINTRSVLNQHSI